MKMMCHYEKDEMSWRSILLTISQIFRPLLTFSMEESNPDSLGSGAIIEHENGTIATNLQRSRSIPEPISDSHDIHNSGRNLRPSCQFSYHA